MYKDYHENNTQYYKYSKKKKKYKPLDVRERILLFIHFHELIIIVCMFFTYICNSIKINEIRFNIQYPI